MSKSKGIQFHAFFKLGKAPVKTDKRTFQFAVQLLKKPTAHAAIANTTST